jgi:hypothetical protein
MFNLRTNPLLLGLVLAQAVAGCSGSGHDGDLANPSATPAPTGPASPPTADPPLPPPVEPPPAPPSSTASAHGYFVGTVTIGETDYYGDALVTVDGAMRLYVGGPYSPSGVIQGRTPGGSVQFVGEVARFDQLAGQGLVIGQECSDPQVDRFCAEPAPASISIEPGHDVVRGELRVTVPEGIETWRLNLSSWDNYYRQPARSGYPAGQYREELAEFATEGDVIVNIDQDGRLFLQSAHSACIGNGSLSPHGDGAFNVYDVRLTLEGCGGPYGHLNGEYGGLATTSPGAYWDYDFRLRTWLSKRADDPTQPAALVLWGPLL